MRKPPFSFSQDADSVTLLITALHLRERDIQFFVGEHEFRFLCEPYALKLSLDGPVVEDGSEKASYCLETGVLRVTLPKKNPGQLFASPQVLVDPDEELFVAEESEGTKDRPPVYYGFNNHYSGVFRGLEDFDVLELADPEGATLEERRLLRLVAEETKFDGDYYIGDLLNADDYAHVLSFVPFWNAHVPRRISELDEAAPPCVAFAERDAAVLARLGPKSFLLENERQICCGLLDILFAYVHHELCMQGEESCEASWTISRVSRVLGWLDVCEESAQQSLVVSYRRALCYPLYRSWRLCQTVHKHVANILRAGPKVVLKCLVNVHHAFTHNQEKRYLLNVVFVDDYIRWIQTVSEGVLVGLADSVDKSMVTKESLELNLIELEQLAHEEHEGEQPDFMMMEVDT